MTGKAQKRGGAGKSKEPGGGGTAFGGGDLMLTFGVRGSPGSGFFGLWNAMGRIANTLSI